MSEQNQLAISPVTAGVIGAGAGAAAGAFIPGMPFRNIKSEYASAQNLLTLEKDQFEKLKPADDAAEEIKNNYDTFVSGRKEIAVAKEADEANLLKDLDTHFDSDTNLSRTNYKYGEGADAKTLAQLEQAVTDAKDLDEVKNAVKENDAVKAAQKAVDELATDAADDVKAAANQKLADAKAAAFAEQPKVKEAQELLDKANADRLDKMKKSIKTASEADGASDQVKALAKRAADGFDVNGKAKAMAEATDSKYAKAFDKMKDLLPKTKMKAALIWGAIVAAAGVAFAYIVGPKNPTPKDVA